MGQCVVPDDASTVGGATHFHLGRVRARARARLGVRVRVRVRGGARVRVSPSTSTRRSVGGLSSQRSTAWGSEHGGRAADSEGAWSEREVDSREEPSSRAREDPSWEPSRA